MNQNKSERPIYSELNLPADQKLQEIQGRMDELKVIFGALQKTGWKPQTSEDIAYVNELRGELATLATGLAELLENDIAREKGHM